MDCADWIIVEPGLSCSVQVPGDCQDDPFCYRGSNLAVDTKGNLLISRVVDLQLPCANEPIKRTEIVSRDRASGTERVLAYVVDRCGALGASIETTRPNDATCGGGGGGCGTIRPEAVLHFDPFNGTLLVPLNSQCKPNGGGGSPCNLFERWLAAFDGFTTTFEVLQTYTPSSSTLGFRVPYMPEGMGGADWFDTYWGTLTHPIDFTQATGLQCHYPATPPGVGDYITVADTLPTPAPGQGYYYVTAATYQGATRYGRKTSGGALSGRDPAQLPACSP